MLVFMVAHPFVAAGYPAPYTFVRAAYRAHVIPGMDGDIHKPGGTCDVCGTCFKYGATFRAADGVEFTTGCDCAVKSLWDVDREVAERAKACKREILAERRAELRAAERARREELHVERENAERAEFESCDVAALAVIAHPLDWAAAKGLSWADAVTWHAERGNFRKASELASEGHALLQGGEFEAVRVLPTIDAAASKHVGAVKQRLTFTARILAMVWFDSDWGGVCFVKMVDTAGNLLVWKTGTPFTDENCNRLPVGTWVSFKGTVKDHGTDKYNDGAQCTYLTRCKQI
jgi:hypothetical protein